MRRFALPLAAMLVLTLAGCGAASRPFAPMAASGVVGSRSVVLENELRDAIAVYVIDYVVAHYGREQRDPKIALKALTLKPSTEGLFSFEARLYYADGVTRGHVLVLGSYEHARRAVRVSAFKELDVVRR